MPPSSINGTTDTEVPEQRGAGKTSLIARLKRRLGLRGSSDQLRDTIVDMIVQEPQDSAVNRDELVLIHNVLSLRSKTAEDAMIVRADIQAVEINTPLDELVKLMSDTAHSRMPVYRDNLDHVVGMVHIKDLLAAIEHGKPTNLAPLVRRLLFVAPSMPVLELLLQMRASRIHMALVVDEYGGTDGLVTIEDLVEEIVGEIEDEHDEESTATIVRRRDNTFEADARATVQDLEKEVGPFLTDEERDEDIDTLGGLVFVMAGRVPGRGEVVRHSSGIEFEILDADARRIKRLHICHIPDEFGDG